MYGSVVSDACDKNKPNVLANYLFVLAQKFSTLYNKVNFIADEDNLQSRINLSIKVQEVLKDGLDLLGIKTLERM
jgi:arginyl-tRNA synthetase